MDVKGDKSSYNFLTKQVKKWGQSVSRNKIFLFLVKFKKLWFSADLRHRIRIRIPDIITVRFHFAFKLFIR